MWYSMHHNGDRVRPEIHTLNPRSSQYDYFIAFEGIGDLQQFQ